MPKSKIMLIILAVLAGIFAYLALGDQPKSGDSDTKTAIQNTKALIGGPFTLVDHHGKNVTQDDFQGQYLLIYFGYTYCPDICPMELQIMAQALDQIPAETLAHITPVFITVDPLRDTVEIMSQYVPAFHEKMIGLTGSEAQIKAVKSAYRVYGAKEAPEDAADPDGYLVSHTSYTYLMDPAGDYVTHFRSRTDPAEMARRLAEIIP